VDTAIEFFISSAPKYISSPLLPIQLCVTSGVPREIAVLIDSTNFTAADWATYSSSNITVNPGPAEGWHEIWIGLRGGTETSPQVWRWTKCKLDQTPPQLIITNPIASTVSQPMIQLQGYCLEPLASISFDLTNAVGVFTNQPISLLDRWFDTNVWEFTTNTFQAFDVPLTNGLNILVLHATDLAGNTTNETLNLTLDYSAKTNPPVVRLYWPQDGAQVAFTSNYTCRGWVDDFTASVIANVTDANGNVSPFNALVERDGKFWIQNLDLSSGTNIIQITVQDAAGNTSVTNITVVAAPLAFTVDGYQAAPFSPTMPTTYVWGSIDSTNCTVWVNGVRAELDGYGAWEVTNAPVTSGGTYLFQARAVPNTDNGGNGSGSGSFSADYSNSGNPASSQAVDAELQEDKPSRTYLASYNYSENETRFSLRRQTCGSDQVLVYTLQYDDSWDTTFSYQDSGQSHKSAISTGDDIFNATETYSQCDTETSWNNWDFYALFGGDSASVTTVCNATNINAYSDHIDKPFASRFCDEKVISDTEGDLYDGSDCFSHIKTHSKITQQEQFKGKLYTGGKSVAGAMKVFGLNGVATKLEFLPVDPGSRSLAPSEFTIGGFGNPDSDSYIYVTLAANQTVDITAKAAVHYYEGGAGQTEVILRIFDANTGNELTDKTTSVVVGQQMSLYCVVSAPTPDQPTAYKWNVPGFAISNYVATANSGTVYSNFPTILSNVVFYWVDGATNRALTCSATVRGQKAVGRAMFNVKKPRTSMTAQITGTVALDTSAMTYSGQPVGLSLHLGTPSPTNDRDGIRFNFELLSMDGYTNTSKFFCTQVGNEYFGVNGTDGQGHSYTVNGLDNSVVYQVLQPTTDWAADSPLSVIGPIYTNKITRQNHFEMHLMFQAQSVPSIAVPLKRVEWEWKGVGINSTGNVWSLDSSASYSRILVNNADATTHPQWTNNVDNKVIVTGPWLP